MTTVTLIDYSAPDYRLVLFLDTLPNLPFANLRRILRRAKADPNNDGALSEMRTFGAVAEQDAKEAWKSASEAFFHGYKKVPRNRRRKEDIEQRAINRKLLAAVKVAKATYERWVKINQLMTERK